MAQLWFTKRLKNEKTKHSLRSNTPKRKFQPKLELLEGRIVPSTITKVQDIGTSSAESPLGITALTISVPAGDKNVSVGDTLILEVVLSPLTGPISVTDTSGNTYNLDLDQTNTSGVRVAVFSSTIGKSLTAGSSSITVHLPMVGDAAASVSEFSGLIANALDQTNAAVNSVPNNNPNSGPVSTNQSGELLIGAIGIQQPSPLAFTPGAQYNSLPGSATPVVAIFPEFQIVSSKGTYSANGTLSGPASWAAGITTYRAAPTVLSITPTSGPAAGGTAVTITGTDFSLSTTGVNFGTTAATSFTVDSETQITAISPAHTLGTVDVTVSNGQTSSPISNADHFTFLPQITSVNPSSGPTVGGNSVVIQGSGFNTTTSVTFGVGGPAASFIVNSDKQITATAPSHSVGTVDIVVTAGGFTTATTASDHYSYVPQVTGLNPPSGSTDGGNAVVITGSGFTNTSAVRFGSVSALFQINSDTQITAQAPAHAAGVVDVSVTNNGLSSAITPSDQYTFVAPQPGVSQVSPNSGSTGGGTTVTITGSGFTGASNVSFGGVPATSFTVISPTQITAASPSHAVGTVDVIVTTAGGASPASPGDQFSYVNMAPVVAGVSPSVGSTGGGTTVVITGTGFGGTTGVSFGNIPAASFTVDSPTQITAVSPAHSPGTVDVIITSPGGTSGTSSSDQFGFITPAQVNSVTPTSGSTSGGTTVFITGSNFTGTTSVLFGNATASFTVNSDTQITATSPSHPAGTVDIVISKSGVNSSTNAADQFTFIASRPAVTALNPTGGSTNGGTTVTITGTDFVGTTAVNFGNTPATSFQVLSPTQISATAPPQAAGVVDVTVVTAGGTSPTSGADQYTYTAGTPSVTSLNPNAGSPAGGTTVVITGNNLIGTTAVSFGGTPAASFTVNSPTQITATSPAHAPGAVDIVVTTAGGSSATSAADRFTFQPSVSAVNPSSGPTTGGTTVTVSGYGFTGASGIFFGGVQATGFTVNSDTQITATSPVHGIGVVDVTVRNGSVTSTTSIADQFTYSPSITSLSPKSGPTAGGTTVTINGSGFTGTNSVTFGGTAASFTVVNDTQIQATSPAHTLGVVDILVTNGSVTSSATPNDQFTYNPIVTGINPTSGTTSGGTTVVINGSGFTGASGVSFGGTLANSFTINGDTQITAVSPPHASGTVDVIVSGGGAASASTAGDRFTFFSQNPTVTGVNPNQGATSGGSTVTITGSNLFGASAVNFGGTPASSFTVVSPTQITAIAPAHAPATVDVTVSTDAGTTSTSPADRFTFIVAPQVSQVNPNSGASSGGTTVVITGTDFTGATGVYFGGTPAQSFTVDSPTQITALSPAHSAGTVDVIVSNGNVNSTPSPADRFTYLGSTAGQLSGVIFYDYNGNGVQNPGELGLANELIFIDTNGNGILDAGEPVTRTDNNGRFSFAGLSPNTYSIRQVYEPNDGVIITSPAGSGYTVVVDAGTSRTDLIFGNLFISEAIPVTNVPNIYPSQKDATTTLVDGVYHNLLGRDAEAAGESVWVNNLNKGMTRGEFTHAVWASAEHRGIQVDRYYVTFLHRNADAQGRANWVRAFIAGAQENDIVLSFVTSAEYLNLNQGPDAFVRELYSDILGRASEKNDIGFGSWVQGIKNGMTVSQVAKGFLTSTEARTRAIDSFYSAFLHRGSDLAGQESWLTQVIFEMPLARVGESILASDEYFANGKIA